MLDGELFLSEINGLYALVNNKQKLSRNETLKSTVQPQAGGQGKYVKYVAFPWSPLEAAMSHINVRFF
jgi:hypothetical protein